MGWGRVYSQILVAEYILATHRLAAAKKCGGKSGCWNPCEYPYDPGGGTIGQGNDFLSRARIDWRRPGGEGNFCVICSTFSTTFRYFPSFRMVRRPPPIAISAPPAVKDPQNTSFGVRCAIIQRDIVGLIPFPIIVKAPLEMDPALFQ